MTYSAEQRLFYKLTELETTFICRHEFNQLKELIEADGKGYSVRDCADKPGYCETYKVVK